MATVTNFDELKRLHDWARTGGSGGKAWIEFATAMFDSFPALYETAKAMNADGKRLREENERLAQWSGSKLMPLMGTPLAIRFDALDEVQAQANHGQTLDRLRERGGLELSEAAAIREKRKWEPMTHTLALHVLSTPKRPR